MFSSLIPRSSVIALPAGQGRDVLQHGLPAIPEARGLDRAAGQRAPELVHHQGRQRLTLDVLRDDEERLARPRHLLQQRQHVLHHADLLLVDQDEGVLEHGLHPLRVRDHVGREVPPVELHPLDDLEGRLHRLGLFDGDDPVLADLLHRLGDEVADGLVVVGGDGRDLGDLLLVLGRLGHLLQVGDDRLDGLLDAALEPHRVRPGRHVLQALAEDRLGEHGRGRGAVPGRVRGLGGDLLDHLGAHVLRGLLQLDLLGHRDAVLGNGRAAVLLVDHHVPALGAERGLHGLRQDVDAAQERRPRLLVEHQLLRHPPFLRLSSVGCRSHSPASRRAGIVSRGSPGCPLPS